MASRLRSLRRWAKGRRFDVALAHGSHELTLTARSLGIPSGTTFDYEWAWLQHQLGCRAARRVVVPEAIPPERLARYGATGDKLRRYPGLKEEYYLADFEPDPAALRDLGVDEARILVVLRPPPDVSLYHRHGNPVFARTLERLGRDEQVHAVVIPRTDEQRGLRPGPRAPVGDRPGARGRRAEPDRVRRPRRLGRRDDEPGGGRARRSRLHDLRRQARRRRRGAHPRGPAGAARRPVRARAAEARTRHRERRVRRDPELLLDLLLPDRFPGSGPFTDRRQSPDPIPRGERGVQDEESVSGARGRDRGRADDRCCGRRRPGRVPHLAAAAAGTGEGRRDRRADHLGRRHAEERLHVRGDPRRHLGRRARAGPRRRLREPRDVDRAVPVHAGDGRRVQRLHERDAQQPEDQRADARRPRRVVRDPVGGELPALLLELPRQRRARVRARPDPDERGGDRRRQPHRDGLAGDARRTARSPSRPASWSPTT